jgi:hypothetical protein
MKTTETNENNQRKYSLPGATLSNRGTSPKYVDYFFSDENKMNSNLKINLLDLPLEVYAIK